MDDRTLTFNPKQYRLGNCVYDGQPVPYRFYEHIPYVARPNAPDLQVMNLYVPEQIPDEAEAPIFLIQDTGGMGESGPRSLENDRRGMIAHALSEGYVVASPGARGRDTVVDGVYVGRGDLPMSIIDLKAAVRYLHYNKGLIPGNPDRICEEGASSGGAMSALLGLTGNSSLYEPYLSEIGAADAGDDIYCCLVNSPITDLEHIDMAYEWLFSVDNVEGLFADDPVSFAMSRAIAADYPAYIDRLDLKNPETGEKLGFAEGDTYTPYLMEQLNRSATVFLSGLSEEERERWMQEEHNRGVLSWDGKKAVLTGLPAYINWNTGRWMRYIGCYDGFAANPSRENEAFGSVDGAQMGHFSSRMGEVISRFPGHEEEGKAWTENAQAHRKGESLINPVSFLLAGCESTIAPLWYLRCGAHHETTANLFLNLVLLLKNRTEVLVDARYDWEHRHTMITDLRQDETFAFLNAHLK